MGFDDVLSKTCFLKKKIITDLKCRPPSLSLLSDAKKIHSFKKSVAIFNYAPLNQTKILVILKRIPNHFVLSYKNGFHILMRDMPNHDRRSINQIVKHY